MPVHDVHPPLFSASDHRSGLHAIRRALTSSPAPEPPAPHVPPVDRDGRVIERRGAVAVAVVPVRVVRVRVVPIRVVVVVVRRRRGYDDLRLRVSWVGGLSGRRSVWADRPNPDAAVVLGGGGGSVP